MPGPLLGLGIAAGAGLANAIFGGNDEPEMINPNIWAMNEDQRTGLADSAYGQQQNQYATDPQAFWGGQNNWTTTNGMPGGGGGDLMNYLMGEGGGGFGHASASHASASTARASLIDMMDESMQMAPSERLRQGVHGQLSRTIGAQRDTAVRQMGDRAQLGGYGSGPAAESMRQNAMRAYSAQIAEGQSAYESAFQNQAGARRAAGLGQNASLQTGTSQFNAGQKNQISMFNAGADNQMSALNAQLGGQEAMMRSGAAEFLLTQRGLDEDRMLERYALQHEMNQDWQTPIAQMQRGTPQPSTFQRFMGGVSRGSQLYGGLNEAGVFGRGDPGIVTA